MICPDELLQLVFSLGADAAALCDAELIRYDAQFRDICRSNACGMYGKCWMCPPAVGSIEEMMEKAKSFDHLLLFQTVDKLEDAFDFEGMMAGGRRMDNLLSSLGQALSSMQEGSFLLMGAGGCRVCESCTMKDGLPCRFPQKAVAGFEAYGIDVSDLAVKARLKYNNGKNTVTFFGGVLWR
ncbi:MAG: DUF2284 domain-containing protein [Oscillospiraceae bacterium]|nr:DUF2284 domain-containing protein [Oscillospiraceae bacterium]